MFATSIMPASNARTSEPVLDASVNTTHLIRPRNTAVADAHLLRKAAAAMSLSECQLNGVLQELARAVNCSVVVSVFVSDSSS